MKLVATLSHQFPPPEGPRALSSLGLPMEVRYYILSLSPPKGCAFRRGPGEGDGDSFNSVCSSGVILGPGWTSWRRRVLF